MLGWRYPHAATARPAVIVALAALLLAIAPAALAQAPANDDFAAATVIGALPFSDAQDTTEATTEATDPDCAGNGHTVWYSFTPSADVRVEANTFGSTYDTTISAWTGSPGGFSPVACNDDAAGGLQSRIRFEAAAGVTYSIMAGSFFDAPGGSLQFSLDETTEPLPPVISISIDPNGSVDARTGTAVIRGTLTCSAPVTGFIEVVVRQRIGRGSVIGFGGQEMACTDVLSWSVSVSGDNGLFVGGRAEAEAFSVGCLPEGEECDDDFASRSVRLRGSR